MSGLRGASISVNDLCLDWYGLVDLLELAVLSSRKCLKRAIDASE